MLPTSMLARSSYRVVYLISLQTSAISLTTVLKHIRTTKLYHRVAHRMNLPGLTRQPSE
jgi:hypothetical protein